VTSVRDFARRERAEFAELLASLTAEQWHRPSLCEGWTVQQVAAHTIAYLGQTRIQLASNMVKARWNIDRLNATGLERYMQLAPERLVDLVTDGIEPTGAGALYGGRVALIECMVHQQDVRRPLGLPRRIPEDRLRVCLDYARISPVIAGARRTRGVRLEATDLEWSAGNGPAVRGPGEALLLTMTGRFAPVVSELDGDGVATLQP
jgi:uncharacterized protein (TIGR03083 family)